MKLPALKYTAPTSIEEACELLAADEDAKIIAAGQSLIPIMAMRLARPSVLIDLARIPGLTDIDEVGDYVRLGSMVTHANILNSRVVARNLPMMAEAGRNIAHAQVRNRGTIGGSVAHGDAAGEWPLVLLALDGMVEVQSVRGRRTIDADDLFIGPFMTTIADDEVLTDIWIPSRRAGWGYGEFARRLGDYGIVNVAVALSTDGIDTPHARVTIGAAVGKVQRIPVAEEILNGAEFAPDLADEASMAGAESLSYISDMHGSAEYRRGLARELIRRTIVEAGVRT